MRQQRAKRYRRAMALYNTSFHFREPYQVLLSSDFILAAHRFKLNLASLLQRTLQAPLKLMITQCSISELYANADPAPIALAKTCERRRCGHIPDPLSTHDCLTSCINISGENKHRYILATQDEQLRGQMRMIPGVPMLYIRRAVMIMEPPSPATLARRDALEREKLGGLEGQGKRKRDEEEDEETERKKKRRLREPNPLSVKKKKKTTAATVMVLPAVNSKQDVVDEEGSKSDVANEQNVIGDVTDSLRRRKSTRRRKHHKNPKSNSETIPAEVEGPKRSIEGNI